jgi:hypothetical protein
LKRRAGAEQFTLDPVLEPLDEAASRINEISQIENVEGAIQSRIYGCKMVHAPTFPGVGGAVVTKCLVVYDDNTSHIVAQLADRPFVTKKLWKDVDDAEFSQDVSHVVLYILDMAAEAHPNFDRIKHEDAGYQGFGVVFNADLDGFPSPPRMSDAYCSRLLLSSSLLVTNGSFMAKAADTQSLVEFVNTYLLDPNVRPGELSWQMGPYPRVRITVVTPGLALPAGERVLQALTFGLTPEEVEAMRGTIDNVNYTMPHCRDGPTPFIARSGQVTQDIFRALLDDGQRLEANQGEEQIKIGDRQFARKLCEDARQDIQNLCQDYDDVFSAPIEGEDEDEE